MALDFISNFFKKQTEKNKTEEQPKTLTTLVKESMQPSSKQKTERTKAKKVNKSLTYTKTTWVFSDYKSHPVRSKYHVSKTLFNEEGLCGATLNPSSNVLPTTNHPPLEKCCKNCLKLVSKV